MKTLFAVPWIDIEYGWGSKPDGFKIFDNLEDCIRITKEDSFNGNFNGGYIGPERPLQYYETTDEITGSFPLFVNKIKFKTDPINIE